LPALVVAAALLVNGPVHAQPGKADLVVAAKFLNPDTLSATIANVGNAPSRDNRYVIESNGRALGNGGVPSLNPGQSITIGPLKLAPVGQPTQINFFLATPDGGQADRVSVMQAASTGPAPPVNPGENNAGKVKVTVVNTTRFPATLYTLDAAQRETLIGGQGPGATNRILLSPGTQLRYRLQGSNDFGGVTILAEPTQTVTIGAPQLVPNQPQPQPAPPVNDNTGKVSVTVVNSTRFPTKLYTLDAAQRETYIGGQEPGITSRILLNPGTQLRYRLQGSNDFGGVTILAGPTQSFVIGAPLPAPNQPQPQPAPPVNPPLIQPKNPGGPVQLSQDEQRLIQLVNAERAKVNLPPLNANANLLAAARGHTANMARQQKMSHDLDGKGMADRITDAGYKYMQYGENIAAGLNTPEAVMNGWMNSQVHRNNILNNGFTEIGVGFVNGYWTQVFGRR